MFSTLVCDKILLFCLSKLKFDVKILEYFYSTTSVGLDAGLNGKFAEDLRIKTKLEADRDDVKLIFIGMD